MTNMISDLFQMYTPHISLFMPCPGAVMEHATLSAQEAFVPNVDVTSDLAMQMLEFFGRIMGIAFRNEVNALYGSLSCECVSPVTG